MKSPNDPYDLSLATCTSTCTSTQHVLELLSLTLLIVTLIMHSHNITYVCITCMCVYSTFFVPITSHTFHISKISQHLLVLKRIV